MNVVRAVMSVSLSAVAVAALPAAQQPATNPRGEVVAEFNARLKQYMETRTKAVSGFKALKDDAQPDEIASREKALGEAIRIARAAAKPGELLGGAVGELVRAASKADFRRRSTKEKQLRLDELPAFKPVVNQTYPSAWPLQT